MRLALGWSHYAMYCSALIKGVVLTCLAVWFLG
jgi:hypothetical protein